MTLEILVPQKWWNANENDNSAWKQETLSTINGLRKGLPNQGEIEHDLNAFCCGNMGLKTVCN